MFVGLQLSSHSIKWLTIWLPMHRLLSWLPISSQFTVLYILNQLCNELFPTNTASIIPKWVQLTRALVLAGLEWVWAENDCCSSSYLTYRPPTRKKGRGITIVYRVKSLISGGAELGMRRMWEPSDRSGEGLHAKQWEN